MLKEFRNYIPKFRGLLVILSVLVLSGCYDEYSTITIKSSGDFRVATRLVYHNKSGEEFASAGGLDAYLRDLQGMSASKPTYKRGKDKRLNAFFNITGNINSVPKVMNDTNSCVFKKVQKGSYMAFGFRRCGDRSNPIRRFIRFSCNGVQADWRYKNWDIIAGTKCGQFVPVNKHGTIAFVIDAN